MHGIKNSKYVYQTEHVKPIFIRVLNQANVFIIFDCLLFAYEPRWIFLLRYELYHIWFYYIMVSYILGFDITKLQLWKS